LCCTPARIGHVFTEDDQAVVVLAHAELPVAEFVECNVHLGHLAGHHVVAGDELVTLEFERPHRFAPGQDREALRLDKLAGLVEQGIQDAGLHRVGVLLDVHQRRIAAALTLPQFELVATEGQAHGRQCVVQRPGRRWHRTPAAVDQVTEELGDLGAAPPALFASAEQLRPETPQHPRHQRRALLHHAQRFDLRRGNGRA
jgi:hypothetical protein